MRSRPGSIKPRVIHNEEVYIFIDILGFGVLPRKLSEQTQFDEDFIREECFSNPTSTQIELVEQRGYDVIQGTDDHVVIVDRLEQTRVLEVSSLSKSTAN
jgi:hypothetical protein